MSRLIIPFVVLCALGCDTPRTCAETEAFVGAESQRIGFEHARPCDVDADCARVESDLICDDGVVALGACGQPVSAAREDDARAALAALRDEVCATEREPCARDVDCANEPVCVDGECTFSLN